MKALIYSSEHNCWLVFQNPLAVLTAEDPEQVPDVIDRAEKAVKAQELWSVGFVSYEAASGFDRSLTTKDNMPGVPLACFALYSEPLPIRKLPEIASELPDIKWASDVEKERYHQDIFTIKARLAEGQTYQVNHTFRLTGDFNGDSEDLFYKLVQNQPTVYSSYIELDDYAICSASPELFFKRQGNLLTSKPMKGTIARGLDYVSDIQAAESLRACIKSQAENVMIVDMIRNDLGKVAVPGSVKVPELFSIEKYPTLWQMTSTVECQSQASLSGIFQALFPCASITGAPKKAAMEIIAELETSPRGVYCGAIGMVSDNNDCCFNVAIRTVLVDKKNQKAYYGSGGGIVWDSTAQSEYDEALLKASMLMVDKKEDFELLETLLFEPGQGIFLLDRHIDRLKKSADFFDFNCSEEHVIEQLRTLERSLNSTSRIRALLNKSGQLTLQSFDLDLSSNDKPVKVSLATEPVSSGNVFLYHKTTNRSVYNDAVAVSAGSEDIILYNERGEITESRICNLVAEIDGIKYTPPVSSGLLAGTYRAKLIEDGDIIEKVITVQELKNADKIYLINSVRKWRIAEIID